MEGPWKSNGLWQILRGNVTSKGPHDQNDFVGGVSISTTADEFKDNFPNYGTVVELPIIQRYSLKGRVYPAIVPAEKKKVNGKLLFDLTDDEIEILDLFEDVEYQRIPVELLVLEGHMQEDCSNWLNGHTYVWSNIHDPDLYGEWDYEEWRDIHMNEFLNMCRSFTSELKQSSTASRLSTCQSVIPRMESF